MDELITTHILQEYEFLKSKVNYQTGGYSVDHAILSGIALGDRKTTNAFKRAHVSFEEGMKCVDSLCSRGIIDIESSLNFLVHKTNNDKIAKRLLFTNPFMRFWFAFVSPIYKGIKEGNFDEFWLKYSGRQSDFCDFIFEELALSFVKNHFEEDPIKDLGQYWDEKIYIPIVAKTLSGQLIAGFCKYSDNKVKKSEYNKFLQDCQNTKISPDIVVIFAKNGYSSELKGLKNSQLKLFGAKHFKSF